MAARIAASSRLFRHLCAICAILTLAPAALGQTAPEPLEPPDPTETPIGTEANALDELPKALAPTSSPRYAPPAKLEFRIATWNLAARKPGEPPPDKSKPKTPTKTWRHTFGTERKTAQWRGLGGSGFAADIIALQGVSGRRTVARLFNARHYHIIVSRQLLPRSTATSTGLAVFRDDAPLTTALVYRRRLGVRIAGFRHFLPRTTNQGEEPAAITAFRLRVYRKMLWVASADIPTDCATDMSSEKCRPHKPILRTFVRWAGQQIAQQKAPLLLLGQWPDAVKDQFAKVGLTLHAHAAGSVECTPRPSAIQVMATEVIKAGTVTLADPRTAETNECVAIADLVLRLVD